MKRNLIEDKNLLGRLERIGFKFDSPTYDDAINWFIEKKKILITLTPAIGKKIDYDTFEVTGWFYELNNMISGGGIFIMGNEFTKWTKSYRHTTKPGEQEELEPVIYATRSEAMKQAVKEATINYLWLQSRKDSIWDGWRSKCIIPKPTEWPTYLCLMEYEGSFHSFYVHDKNNTYKKWKKDEFPDIAETVKVVWDGQDFLIVNTLFSPFIGKQLYPVTEKDLAYNWFKRNGIEGFREVIEKENYSDYI